MSTTSLGQTGSANAITINNANGNVGIGTTNPSTALQVAGTITATGYAGLPAATTSAAGVVTVDGTSITATSGVISAVTPPKSAYGSFNATSVQANNNYIAISASTLIAPTGLTTSGTDAIQVPSTGVYVVSIDIISSGTTGNATSSIGIRNYTTSTTYATAADYIASGDANTGFSATTLIQCSANDKIVFVADKVVSNTINGTIHVYKLF
jgi:hypothetical protein